MLCRYIRVGPQESDCAGPSATFLQFEYWIMTASARVNTLPPQHNAVRIHGWMVMIGPSASATFQHFESWMMTASTRDNTLPPQHNAVGIDGW